MNDPEKEDLAGSAARARMDKKRAQKYRRSGKLPSRSRPAPPVANLPDPFEGVWEQVPQLLVTLSGLEGQDAVR